VTRRWLSLTLEWGRDPDPTPGDAGQLDAMVERAHPDDVSQRAEMDLPSVARQPRRPRVSRRWRHVRYDEDGIQWVVELDASGRAIPPQFALLTREWIRANPIDRRKLEEFRPVEFHPGGPT